MASGTGYQAHAAVARVPSPPLGGKGWVGALDAPAGSAVPRTSLADHPLKLLPVVERDVPLLEAGGVRRLHH